MSSPTWQGRSTLVFHILLRQRWEGVVPAGLSPLSGLPLIMSSRSMLGEGSTGDVGRLCACSLKHENKFCAHFKAGACLVAYICLKFCSPTLQFTHAACASAA